MGNILAQQQQQNSNPKNVRPRSRTSKKIPEILTSGQEKDPKTNDTPKRQNIRPTHTRSRSRVSKKGPQRVNPLYQKYILSIEVYEQVPQNFVLDLVGAKHCYVSLNLQNERKIVVQRNAKGFEIIDGEKIKNATKIGDSLARNKLTMEEMKIKIQAYIAKNTYHITDRNCYDLGIFMMNLLDCDENQIDKVKEKKEKIILHSANNILQAGKQCFKTWNQNKNNDQQFRLGVFGGIAIAATKLNSLKDKNRQ